MDKNSNWKTTERIVEILERFITEDSTVEHNKYLPVIGRPEREHRQCDVVITFNKPPRQFIAIVEIQDRDSKPDITTFHGWIAKKNEVGAQQLICVTKVGYPQSIIDEVKNKYGNSVTLMTLDKFDYLANPQKFNQVPIQIVPKRNFEIIECSEVRLEKSDKSDKIKEISFATDDEIFTLEDSEELVSLNKIIGHTLDNICDVKDPYSIGKDIFEEIIEFKINDTNKLYLHIETKKLLVMDFIMKIKMITRFESHPIIVNQYKYTQEIINGTISWVSHSKILIGDVEKEIVLTFKTDKTDENYLNISCSIL